MGVVDQENIDDPKLLDDALNLFLVQDLSTLGSLFWWKGETVWSKSYHPPEPPAYYNLLCPQMKQVGCGVELKHVGCGLEPRIFCQITLMVIYPGLMYYHLKLSMYNWTLWLCDDGLILCLWWSQGSDCTHFCHVSFDSMSVLLELMQQLLSKCYCGVCSGIA